jgi:hypothetical protein
VAFYFAPISNGLGDLIVSIPILQSLIATGTPTYLIMRSPAQWGLSDSLEGLAGSIREDEFNPLSLSSRDKLFNFRDHPLQTDFIWGSSEFEERYPGYKINDVLKGICADWGIEADFENLKPLPFRTRSECSGRILLIPGSSGRFKCWPVKHWLDLNTKLQDRGLSTFIIGQPDRSDVVATLVDFGLDHIETPTLKDALDVVSSSLCAVSVDTGLMHLSVHQGIPIVALFRYNTMFMRPCAKARNFAAPRCPSECIELELSGAPNEKIEYKVWENWTPMSCALETPEDSCMSKISPDEVFTAVTEMVAKNV